LRQEYEPNGVGFLAVSLEPGVHPVRVRAPVNGLLGISRRAFVIQNTLYIPPEFLPLGAEVLVHELCHVWQQLATLTSAGRRAAYRFELSSNDGTLKVRLMGTDKRVRSREVAATGVCDDDAMVAAVILSAWTAQAEPPPRPMKQAPHAPSQSGRALRRNRVRDHFEAARLSELPRLRT